MKHVNIKSSNQNYTNISWIDL